MRPGSDRCPDSCGLRFEGGIMPDVLDMYHLMLERVAELIGKQFVVLATDLDQFIRRSIRTGASHSVGVFDTWSR